jgi:hypothetical protein
MSSCKVEPIQPKNAASKMIPSFHIMWIGGASSGQGIMQKNLFYNSEVKYR